MVLRLVGGPLGGNAIETDKVLDTVAILPPDSNDGVAFRYNRVGDHYEFVAYILPPDHWKKK